MILNCCYKKKKNKAINVWINTNWMFKNFGKMSPIINTTTENMEKLEVFRVSEKNISLLLNISISERFTSDLQGLLDGVRYWVIGRRRI